MIYTVVWRPSAERKLAQLWADAVDRPQVTAAANTIDTALRRDPSDQGEARAGPTRLLFEPPLAVLFDVSEPDRLVTVWAVWRWPGHA